MTTALLTALLLASAPATGLTVAAQLGKESVPAATYLDAIQQELLGTGLAVRRLPLTCEGKRDCLLQGGREAQLDALVAVTIATTKKRTTLDLEALRLEDGTTVAQLTFASGGRLSDADKAALRKFGEQLAAALIKPEPDAPLADARPPSLTPPPTTPPLEVRAPALAPRSRVPAYVFGGGAVAGAITSGVFLGLASDSRRKLESTPDPSPLTRTQAEGLAADANRDYTVALAAGLAAGALATAAVLWLVTE